MVGISWPSEMNGSLPLYSSCFIIQPEERSDVVLQIPCSFSLLFSLRVWALCLPSRGSQSNRVEKWKMQCKDTIIHVATKIYSIVKVGGIGLVCIAGVQRSKSSFAWNSSPRGTTVLKTYSNFLLPPSTGKLIWESIREVGSPAWSYTVTKWNAGIQTLIQAFFPIRMWENQCDKLMGVCSL